MLRVPEGVHRNFNKFVTSYVEFIKSIDYNRKDGMDREYRKVHVRNLYPAFCERSDYF